MTKREAPKLSGLLKMGAVVAPNEVAPIHDESQAGMNQGGNSPFQSRNLQALAVTLIDPNPLAPREIYTSTMILERAEALRSQGQHDPIHVIPNPQFAGRYIIIDGWTRVLACIQHDVFPTLLAEIHTELTLEAAAWYGYEQNEERQQHCDLDRAFFYEKLIARGIPANEIARRAKLSKTLMSFYRAYSKLPEDVLEIIRASPNKFGANAVYQLWKLHEKCGVRKTVALAGKYAAEDQTYRWLSNQAQAFINPNAQNKLAPSRQIRYVNGYYKQRGDIFEIAITVADEHKKAFSDALEALLNTVAIQTSLPDANTREN